MSSFYSGPAHSSAATIRPGGPLQEFRDLLISCTRKSVIHEPHREFMLVNRMLRWFRSGHKHSPGSTNAGRVLVAVYDETNEEPVKLILNLLEAMTATDDSRCWLKIFIILLRMDRGIYIEHFWNHRVLDRHLPISKGEMLKIVSKMPLPESEGDRSQFTKEFFKLQYELCTKDSLDGRKLEDPIILPICKMEPIRSIVPEDEGSGKEIKVFLIEVPCDSIPPNILSNIKSKPFLRAEDDDEEYHEFALKVLKNDEEYSRESLAYNALRGSDGIVQCLGNWEIQKQSGESEYHLLLEYGSYDLDDYFENFAPPSLPRAIIKFWDQLSDVAVALDKIHNLQHTVESRTAHSYGWHGDIKPENLVFCEGKWKIADPGFARIESQRTVTLDEGFPVIMLEGGTEYYGPPEQTLEPRQPVTQLFDIWSLGCVFSEAATWLLLGYRGVEQFRMVRKLMQPCDEEISLTQIEGDDCFHNGTEVSQGVLAWHQYLRNSLREKDRITEAILKLTEGQMLIKNAKRRISSKDLVHRLKGIIQNAKEDKSLVTYSPPAYFKVAFEAEQRKRATEWSKPTGPTRRSNRHKSTRLQNSPGSVLMGLEGAPYERSHIYPPVLETDYAETTQPGERGQYGDYHIMTQDALMPTTTGQVLSMNAYSDQSVAKKQDTEKFDYWDALHLLESQGWVYKGTLERPGNAPARLPQTVIDAQALKSPPPSLKSLDPAPQEKEKVKKVVRTTQRGAFRKTPPVTQHRSIARSIIAQKFWRRNNKETASVFQKDFLVSMPASSPPVTARTLSSGAMDMDIKLKNMEIEDYFLDRDILFLLDNGSTMGKHWPRVRELVAALVTLLHGQDDNGMEMYFTSSATRHGPITEPHQFVDIINRMRPESEPGHDPAHPSEAAKRADDIRKTLSQILSLVGQPDYKRKLTLIIFTDGIWSGIGEKRTVADKIVNCFREWQDEEGLKKMLDDRGLNIQFIQFGYDEEATKEFDYMDHHLAKPNRERLPDIIDVETASGNVWKMILGSLSTLQDNDGPPTVTSEGSQSRAGGPESVAATNPIMFLQRRSTDLVEEPTAYSHSYKPSNSTTTTDHYGAQFDPLSPKPGGQTSRQARDPGGPSERRRGKKDTGSTACHAHSRSG